MHASTTRNKFVVITGVSGSGKSSLAFDTLFAEGQRRYVESLSMWAVSNRAGYPAAAAQAAAKAGTRRKVIPT